jgi:catechol 2,3-dioxygenase-like lactoylglutathione lyase family enzyme
MILLRDLRYVRRGTRDLDASARFARDILGLEPADIPEYRDQEQSGAKGA